MQALDTLHQHAFGPEVMAYLLWTHIYQLSSLREQF